MMRTANPALNANTFSNFGVASQQSRTMTIQGTVNRTGFLLFLLMAGAIWVWRIFFDAKAAGDPQAAISAVSPWLFGGMIGGLVFGIITAFVRKAAPITAPIYAVLEGMFLGGISAIFELRYQGIVIQAVGLTFGTLFALLFAYTSRLIKPTQNFRLGVFAATGGIAMIYFATMILGFFGVQIPYIHGSGPVGIGFSLFVVIIAALNLVLDFDFIENGAAAGCPKYMEWYAAFGLLVTLVWLYLEMLRLLSKIRDRR